VRRGKIGFWALGGLLLAGLLLSCAELFVLERRYRAVKAEYDAMRRQMYEIGMGRGDGEGFDWERYKEVDREYGAAYQARHQKRHSPEAGITVYGIGLFLWLLTLLRRGAVRAAKWSEAREERRERDKDPWE